MLYTIIRALIPDSVRLTPEDEFQLQLEAANMQALKDAEEDRFFSKGRTESKWPHTQAWIDERMAKRGEA